jgi:hypothetical protein
MPGVHPNIGTRLYGAWRMCMSPISDAGLTVQRNISSWAQVIDCAMRVMAHYLPVIQIRLDIVLADIRES